MRQGNQIVYANGFDAIFGINTLNRDLSFSIISSLVMILILSANFTVDRANKEEHLYKLTKNGNQSRVLIKQWVTLAVILLTYFIVFGTDILYFCRMYPMKGWLSPLSSILRMNTDINFNSIVSTDGSILRYFLLVQSIRFIGLFFIASLSNFISSKSKDRVLVVVITLLILIIPVIAGSFGIEVLNILDIISGNQFLMSDQGVIKPLLMIVISALLIKFQFDS